MNRKILLLAVAAALAGCTEAAQNAANNEAATAAANAVAASEKHSPYCFFKNEELKAWKASFDKSGNVTVTGKAHVKDSRYKPELGQPKVAGTHAELWPTITVNTGYASPDNWWDVSFTIPASASVTDVAIRCGSKTAAELTVKR